MLRLMPTILRLVRVWLMIYSSDHRPAHVRICEERRAALESWVNELTR
jgi:hypothetical protein